jgi:hypothetical protein
VTTRRLGTLVVWLLVAAVAFMGRFRRPGPLTGEERTPSPALPAVADGTTAISTPPSPAEIHGALLRAFFGCVEIPPMSGGPVVGDFNGDGSQDLAVMVRPSEERSYEINDALRNWVVQDLRLQSMRLVPARSPRVEKGEALVAVLHGHGPAGWRSPEARQAYLLKNAAMGKLGAVRRAGETQPTSKRPPLRGDAIVEEVNEGTARFLYWTGARYASWP